MTATLELKSVSRRFEEGSRTLEILKSVDLNVEAGELVCLVGASGSGKSTLLQIAGLLDQASSGDIVIGGQVMNGLSDRARTDIRRDKIGFVYQFHHLLPDFTALENVSVAGRIQGLSAKRAKSKASDLLDQMGLAERVDHIPSRLSGGEQQRVAIARALMGDPMLLLADEPTGNLDTDTSERVFAAMTNVIRSTGAAALIVTHDLSLAQQADRIFTLKSGHIAPV